MLIDSLPEGTVRWGHKVASVTASVDGRHEVSFANGSTILGDVLVAADGAWSKVRPLASDAKPLYTGTCFIETFLSDGDTRHKASADAIGKALLQQSGPDRGARVVALPQTSSRLEVQRFTEDGDSFRERTDTDAEGAFDDARLAADEVEYGRLTLA